MKIIINGAAGRMGRAVADSASAQNIEIAAKVDKFATEEGCLQSLDDFNGNADVIIDFSNHLCTADVCRYAANKKIPVVIATTGQTEEELDEIKNVAKSVAVFKSANMSLGVAVLCDLTRRAVAMFPGADIEIVEAHHNRKLDAPSGTALMLRDAVAEERPNIKTVCGREGQSKRTPDEVGIHSLRMGNVVGEHTVYISTDTEILTLSHKAETRAVFADGAIVSAKYLIGREPGLYNMKDVLRG